MEIIARSLRERVTVARSEKGNIQQPTFNAQHSINSEGCLAAGIETIWRTQITDERGFERIYVAAMRSCGVPARLDGRGKAEFHTGTEWKPAPRPLVETGLP